VNTSDPSRLIAFQGAPGAYSDLACRHAFPDLETLPCTQFEDAFAAVREGQAALGMIPIENSVAGRVADIHHLMPDSGLFITCWHCRARRSITSRPCAAMSTRWARRAPSSARTSWSR
jgi:prephenate dehydratase